jgi:hypothetical protein
VEAEMFHTDRHSEANSSFLQLCKRAKKKKKKKKKTHSVQCSSVRGNSIALFEGSQASSVCPSGKYEDMYGKLVDRY